MTRHSKSAQALSFSTVDLLKELGENIRLARKRRGMTMNTMASRMMVSRKTLHRLEKGERTVGLHVLASALFILGLENDLKAIADPEFDTLGLMQDKSKYHEVKRVREKKPEVDMDF